MHNIHTIHTYTYKIHTNIFEIHTKLHANTCTYMHFDLGVGQSILYVCACISWAVHMCMYVWCMCMYLCVSVCMCVKYTTCAYALQMSICTPSGGPKCALCATHGHFIRLSRSAILSQAPSEMISVSSTLQRILIRLQQSLKTASWHRLPGVCMCMYPSVCVCIACICMYCVVCVCIP